MSFPKIVVADDEPDVVESLRFRLTQEGYEVVTATGASPLPAELAQEVRKLRQDELVERQADRGRRPGQDEDRRPPGQAGQRPREHGGGADLPEGEHPEELAEAVDPPVEQALDDLDRGVPARDPGAAGGHDHLGLRRAQPLDQTGVDRGRLVPDQRPGDHPVPGAREPRRQEPSALVGLGRPGVGDGQDRAGGGEAGGGPAVLFGGHGCIIEPSSPGVAAMSLENKIRAFAGSFVLASLALGWWVHPGFYLFTAFVGANLLQSAFTHFCPLEKLLLRLDRRGARPAAG